MTGLSTVDELRAFPVVSGQITPDAQRHGIFRISWHLAVVESWALLRLLDSGRVGCAIVVTTGSDDQDCANRGIALTLDESSPDAVEEEIRYLFGVFSR